jgi:hypothetical protein
VILWREQLEAIAEGTADQDSKRARRAPEG